MSKLNSEANILLPWVPISTTAYGDTNSPLIYKNYYVRLRYNPTHKWPGMYGHVRFSAINQNWWFSIIPFSKISCKLVQTFDNKEFAIAAADKILEESGWKLINDEKLLVLL
jgi:hypothetical protein